MCCQLSSTRVGVAAVDSSLGFINSFLEGIVPTEDSFAYVVEADGDVVGTSEQVVPGIMSRRTVRVSLVDQ